MSYEHVARRDEPESSLLNETTDEESVGSARELGQQEAPIAAGKDQRRLQRVTMGACLLALAVFVCAQAHTPGLQRTSTGDLSTISLDELPKVLAKTGSKGCKKASSALLKVVAMSRLEEAEGHASSEDKAAAGDIIHGKHSSHVLHEVESVISHATLEDAAKLGSLVTEDDMNSLVDCELGETAVHLEESDGDDALEGDMLVPNGEDGRRLQERILQGEKWAGELWKNGEIKYCYQAGVNADAKKAFDESVKHVMEQVPCVKFKEVARKDDTSCVEYPSIILLSPDIKKCNSYVGCIGWDHKSQAVNLGKGCEAMGTSAHELGHAMGMTHEQSRADREGSIVIHYDHIKTGKDKNFRKRDDAFVGTPYDILSLMHYGAHSFSTDGHRTIETTNQEFANFIGQRVGLSQLDVEQIGEMYGCAGSVTPKTMNKELSYSLAKQAKATYAPYTKAGCMCMEGWDDCANSKNGFCCTPKGPLASRGNFCKTLGDCDGRDWDECKPREAIQEDPWYIEYPKTYVLEPITGGFYKVKEVVAEHLPL